jgi:hypothetical protein
MTTTTPRTYQYIRALVKRANAASSVQHMVRNHAEKMEFEKKYAAEIAEAWTILEASANKGCIRLFLRDHPVFQRSEIQAYFGSKGFGFSDNSMEWWHEPKEAELR